MRQSHVWGFSDIKDIERLHLKFGKYILHVKKSTPNSMVYSELGRYPLLINIKVRMVTFWGNLMCSNGNKLSSKCYYLLCNNNSSWTIFVKKIVDDCGLSYVWITQNFINISWLRNTVFHIV